MLPSLSLIMQMFDYLETEGFLYHFSLAALRSLGHQPIIYILELAGYICSPFKPEVGDQVQKMKKNKLRSLAWKQKGWMQEKGLATLFLLS